MDSESGSRRECRAHALPRVAREARPLIRFVCGAMAMVRRRSRRVLGLGLGVLRHPCVAAVRARAGEDFDARRRMVSGRAPELRGACASQRTRGCGRAALFERAPRRHGAFMDRSRVAGTKARDALAGARSSARRPGRRLSAEFAGGGHRDAGDGQRRRDLGELRPGLRSARRRRPIFAVVREIRVLRRWLLLRRQAVRSPAGAAHDPRGAAVGRARDPIAAVGPAEPREAHVAYDLLGRCAVWPRSRARRLRVRAGAVRASAVDPVLLRYDRLAEADHPQPRRHHHRTVQGAAVPHGRARRRTHVLLHDDRLDDVELPRQRAARRCRAGALRRQSGLPRTRCPLGDGRAHGGELFRREPDLPGNSREGRHRAEGPLRS